jgi:hypothetical protein
MTDKQADTPASATGLKERLQIVIAETLRASNDGRLDVVERKLLWLSRALRECTVPPEGWWCSREPGHEGPCAARPTSVREAAAPADPDPQCRRCNGTGDEPNAQFRCPCRWRHVNIPREAAAALPEPLQPQPRVDNGNTFVFCDYVSSENSGCIRGAGHNGGHVFLQQNITPPLAPVLMEPEPLLESLSADTSLLDAGCGRCGSNDCFGSCEIGADDGPSLSVEEKKEPPVCMFCDGCGWCEGSPAFTCPRCKGTGHD